MRSRTSTTNVSTPTMNLPNTDYYFKALDSIPKEHTHRDEIVSLLIDQVIDDTYGYSTSNRSTSEVGARPD